ncbi:MAG TPA: hypothetical protein VHB77_20310, partial [Planctomycetaceae bacterium]|nr:hypothetical protein [Planctomycetaceae bacterium]
DIASWCSRIPAEEQALYPIDQSDGGEDDDPREHADWAAKLKSLGRNPGMPWKKQSPLITIDADRDFITDRGDEVWSILEARGIEHVILTGVHTNMCVLGRPFGLRQMARNGRDVVLMRDMTDCMYNPQRWPYVDHFTGCDLIISHVERYICPTITSDQLLGGKPFRSQSDRRGEVDVAELPRSTPARGTFEKQWSAISIPSSWKAATAGQLTDYTGVAWYRCAVRLPGSVVGKSGLDVACEKLEGAKAWLNGHALPAKTADGATTFHIEPDWVTADDANLLVLRVGGGEAKQGLASAPVMTSADRKLSLAGRWQFRLGDDPAWSNIPLPAKFGGSPDMFFEFATGKE